jgi:hypothetical protein
VSVGFPVRFAGAEKVRGDASGPGEGDGDDGHQEGELARAGEAGVLDVEATGLGVSEHALDGPPAAVGGERAPGRQVGDDGQPAVREALGGEGEGGPARAPRPEAAAEGAGPLRPVQAGEEGELAAILGDDAQVLPQADGEGNTVIN